MGAFQYAHEGCGLAKRSVPFQGEECRWLGCHDKEESQVWAWLKSSQVRGRNVLGGTRVRRNLSWSPGSMLVPSIYMTPPWQSLFPQVCGRLLGSSWSPLEVIFRIPSCSRGQEMGDYVHTPHQVRSSPPKKSSCISAWPTLNGQTRSSPSAETQASVLCHEPVRPSSSLVLWSWGDPESVKCSSRSLHNPTAKWVNGWNVFWNDWEQMGGVSVSPSTTVLRISLLKGWHNPKMFYWRFCCYEGDDSVFFLKKGAMSIPTVWFLLIHAIAG